MKRLFSQSIWYLFIPEESIGTTSGMAAMPIKGRRRVSGISLKAVFWAGMAVAVALMVGQLS